MSDIVHDVPGALMPRHKADLADLCPICGPLVSERKVRDQRIAAFHRSFVQFGYEGLTLAETAAAYDVAIREIPTAADGIIAMLIRSQLEAAGIVPGVGL